MVFVWFRFNIKVNKEEVWHQNQAKTSDHWFVMQETCNSKMQLFKLSTGKLVLYFIWSNKDWVYRSRFSLKGFRKCIASYRTQSRFSVVKSSNINDSTLGTTFQLSTFQISKLISMFLGPKSNSYFPILIKKVIGWLWSFRTYRQNVLEALHKNASNLNCS